MSLISKEQFLQFKTEHEEYEIKGLGAIGLKKLSGRGRQTIIRLIDKAGDDKAELLKLQANIVSLVAVDEQGELLFSKDDVEAIIEKDADIIEDLSNHILRSNGLTKESVKEAEKN